MSRREACTFFLALVGLALPACHNASSPARAPAEAAASTPTTPAPSGQDLLAAAQPPAACCGSSTADHEACEQGGHELALQAAAPAACGDAHAHAACGEAACAHAEAARAEAVQPTAATAHHVQAATNTLTRLDVHDGAGVCMLSNRYLGERADVPVDVDGKTYHGCCANCAARLGMQAEARMATDPVTGRPVDKASAVLARDANNRLFYFESERTLAQYSAR